MSLSYDLDSVQKFGCLTIDGQVYPKASEYGAGVISFGDTDQASEESLLSWLPFEGKWVSNQVNLTSVSWKQLHEQALCRGRVVIIDEKPYLCRSLTTESPDGGSSEWDRFIRLYRNLDYIFHWRGEYTWRQASTQPKNRSLLRPAAGKPQSTQSDLRCGNGPLGSVSDQFWSCSALLWCRKSCRAVPG